MIAGALSVSVTGDKTGILRRVQISTRVRELLTLVEGRGVRGGARLLPIHPEQSGPVKGTLDRIQRAQTQASTACGQ